MTDSIKPPGSGSAASAVVQRAHVDATGTVTSSAAPDAASAASGPSGASAILAEQLKTGTLTAAQVIDAVVAQAIDSARAQGLPASERENLESILRAALVDDPTLAGLGRELER